MSEFTEAKFEEAFIELLENEEFPHYLGNTISRADDSACADTAEGFILKRENRKQKDIHIELIDYSGLDAQRKSKDLDNIFANAQRTIGKIKR